MSKEQLENRYKNLNIPREEIERMNLLLIREQEMQQHMEAIANRNLATSVGGGEYASEHNVFVDNFNRVSVSPGGTPSIVYTSTITGLGGISIISGTTTGSNLRLRADNTNTTGRLYTMSKYSIVNNSHFNSQLNLNPTRITWTVNVKNNWNTILSGFDSGVFGQAVILASGGTNVLTDGFGYALVYGGSGTRQWRLASFTGGLQANSNITTILSTPTSGFGDSDYLSLKVTYDASINRWSLAFRNDLTAWVDSRLPEGYNTATTATNSTYITTPLDSFGYLYNFGSTLTANASNFDNFNVYYN
jgi:hypothetical protein